jgi:hypothetical protein
MLRRLLPLFTLLLALRLHAEPDPEWTAPLVLFEATLAAQKK